MKKKTIKMLIPLFLSLTLLTGCQKTPEVSKDDEILRAKNFSEEAAEEIVNEKEEVSETPAGPEIVSAVLGNGENRMRIEAEIVPAPEAVNIFTMQAESKMNEDTMRQFLEPQGEIEDITQNVLAEEEAERQRVAEIDEKLGEGSSMYEIASVGDGSRLAMTDGNRTAVFVGKTGGSFQDTQLKEKCYIAANKNEKELDVKDAEAGETSFSLQDAKELLRKKLSFLGIEDIHLFEACSYEADGFLFYEVRFSPVIAGIPIAHSFSMQDIERVYPDGFAWVCAEGVAEVDLWNTCMEQSSASEKKEIISFNKVQDLLEIYLDNGSLQCTEEVPFSTAELVYYAELKDGKLELVPMWCIHMDFKEYVEYMAQNGRNDSVWNIYMNAVTGELKEVQ